MDETRIAEAVGKAVRSLLPRSITPQEAHKLAKAVRCRARSMGVKAVIAVSDAHDVRLKCEHIYAFRMVTAKVMDRVTIRTGVRQCLTPEAVFP